MLFSMGSMDGSLYITYDCKSKERTIKKYSEKGNNIMKLNKKGVIIHSIISSIILIIPIIIGVFWWDKLPDKVPIHFSSNGIDNYASKFYAIVILGLILLGIHILSVVVAIVINNKYIEKIPMKNKIESFFIVLVQYTFIWLMPLTSIICYYLIYSNVL